MCTAELMGGTLQVVAGDGLTDGPAVDAWSLGCILAELALKRPLFPANSASQLLAQVCISPNMVHLSSGTCLPAKRMHLKKQVLKAVPSLCRKEPHKSCGLSQTKTLQGVVAKRLLPLN